MTTTTILRAVWDPNLFRNWFRDPTSWAAWFVFLKTLFALPVSEDELATYHQCTGRTEPPSAPATEAWLICGRRAGKSFILALCAVYLACFHEYRRYLTPGERGVIVIIARDRKQGKVIFNYIRALLTQVPMLAQQIEKQTAESFDLAGDVSIEIMTASFRSIRGRTVVACLADEIAFWPTDDAADPDYAVLDAVRPAMATIPNAMLLCASSPYARKGALFDAHQRHYAKENDPVLVWKAPTTTMNPTIARSVIDAAMERDASDALAEWMAEFRSDLESFISRETVLACVEPNVFERPPQAGVRYESFVDPSGGSNDSMTLAIGHLEGGTAVIDCLREAVAPFTPDDVVDEFVQLLARYHLRKTNGDRYAAAWVTTAFEKRGVHYRHSELPRSQLYLNMLPHLNSRTVRLLDHPRMVAQIASLERRTARGARDTVDHPRDQHDDLANAIAGLVFVTAQRPVEQPVRVTDWNGNWWGNKATMRNHAEANVRNGSAPCTLTAAELASTEPSDELVRRWQAQAEAKVKADQQPCPFAVDPKTGRPTGALAALARDPPKHRAGR
jgi:hypothetical protein